ncbi:retention module-containing protein [Pectobacterium cacticida]|uniref:retention module-containing protein n=1 Tax=Pectobacterium cacticida TaxID=69221 RepID=UPI003985D446
MNNVVGIIKFVIGQVFVISLDGVQRLLMVGDKIYRGEEIVTGGDGAVTITLPDGRSLDVGRNSQWSDNGDITPQEAPQDADEVAALQEAILQGADPTQILEATAAGNTDVGEAGDGGGSHTAVVLDLTGQIVDPTVGYPTAGIGFATDNLVETDGFDTQSLAFPLPEENNDAITLRSDGRVIEGGNITVTATVNNPVTGSDLVIGLTNGSTITIPVGETTGRVEIGTRPDDAYRQGDEPIQIGIGGTQGGSYTNLDTSSSTSTTVVDDSDATTITLSTPETVTEGGTYQVTATVDNPVTESDLVITLTNGATVTIPVGATTGVSEPIATRPDDAYQQGDEPLNIGIDTTTGGNFEALNKDATTTVKVVDDSDATTITLTAPETVTEGGTYQVTATVDNPVTESDLVITLTNGATVTIPVGATTGVSEPIATRPDDAYQQGDEPLNIGIDTTTGGNFEALNKDATTTVKVVDDSDATTITLTTPETVTEGGTYQVTATVDNPVTESDLVITLTNGATVTIPVGATTGVSEPIATRPDDAYQQGDEPLNIGIDTTTGGNFEALNNDATTTVKVVDDSDAVHVTIESNGDVTEAEDAVFTIRVDTQLPDDLLVTLKNGDQITIKAGEQSAEYRVPAQGDDVYVDAGEVTVGIGSVVVEGKEFENLLIGGDATVNISDTVDTVNVTIASNGDVTEAEDAVFTIKVDTQLPDDLLVTLKNGDQVTIKAGEQSVEYRVPAQGDDVYVDPGEVTVGIGSVVVEGKEFENLLIGGDATVNISDTVDTVNVTIASNGDVTEAQEAVFTVNVDRVLQDDLVVTLSTGETVTIAAGQQSVEYRAPAQGDDVYKDAGSVTVGIDGAVVEGKEFEDLVIGEPATVQISDTIDTVNVTIASNGDVTEAQEAVFTVNVDRVLQDDLVVTLSTGETVTIAAGQQSVEYRVPAQGDDVYKDAGSVTVGIDGAVVEGKEFEDLKIGEPATVQISDTIDPVTATLTANATSVAEGGELTYTVTLTGPEFADFSKHDGVKFELVNGEVVEIKAGETSGSVTITAPNDVFVGGQPAIENRIKGVLDNSDSEFEQLNTTGTTRVAVTDEPGTPGNPGEPGTPNGGEAITVSITADKAEFAENEEQTFTVSLDKAVDRDVVVTLDGGKTVTIAKGTTSVAYQRPEQGEDVYKDGETIQVALQGAKAADGAAFENLTLGDPATIQVVDTESPVTATLTANATSVAEGGEITYTVTLTGPAFADFTKHDGVKFELANGEVVEIAASQTSGSVTITAPDDVFVGGQPAIENHIKGVLDNSDSEFEQLNTTGTTRVAVTDEPGTPGNPGEPGTPNGGEAITVSITADKAEFAENEEQTFTVSLDKAVDRDVVVTLDGGKTVTIAKGTTSVAYQRPEQGEDVYKDSETISVALEGAKAADGAAFENLTLGDAATIQVVDTESPVTATLTANATSVAEGGEITYTVTLTGPEFADFSKHDGVKFELANGEVVEIKAGETSGSVTITAPDDVFVGGQLAIENSIKGVLENSDSEFEKLNTTGTTRVEVTDEPGTPEVPVDPQNPGNQGDAITVSITADKAEFAENEEQTFTVSLDKAVDRDVVVTLDGGKTVTIAKGTTSVAYQRPEQGEDVYKDSETIQVALQGAKAADGAAFENLTLGDAATIQVVDTESPVTATLTANATSVAEGGEITYTVTLTGPAFADFTKHDGVKFELANGEVVEIAAGQTSGSVTITAPDDVFVGGQPAIENHIKGVLDNSDSEFEQLNTTGTTRVAVTDEPGTPGNPGEPGTPNGGEAITVSITADKAEFAENEEQTFTVSLDKAVDRDVVVTLDGGKTVTIAKGTTSVAYQRPEQGEDVYKDSETISVALEGAKAADGAAFENLTLGKPAQISVTDTIDPVTAELSVNPNPVVEGNEVEYTITLKGPEGTNLDLSQHDGLTIKLDNGKTIEIKAGETSGSVKDTIADDVFVGGKTQTVGIKSITEAATEGSGKQFENLIKGEDVTLAITDEPGTPGNPGEPGTPNAGDAITVSITADKASFAENEEQTFTVSLDKAVDRDVVVTLDGGKTVTIAKGTTSVAYQRPEQGEDVYKDSETISVALEDAKAADGAAFENLTLGDAATIQVVDTESPVTATLTANATSVAEGGEITYTVTLTGPAFADFTKHDGVKFELANGEVVEIAAGQTSGSVTITAPDDVFVGGQPAIENHIKGVLDNSDSEFEQLNTTGTTRVAVTDEPGTPGNPGEPGTPNGGEAITVSITADKAEFAENEEQTFTVSLDKAVDRDVVVTLDGGKTVTIAKGTTSVGYQRPEQGEDVYKDSETISVALEGAKGADNAVFENLTLGAPATVKVTDTIDKVTAELSVNPNPVVEGNEVEYTITLKGPEGTNLDLSKHDGLTITLDNGKTITIAAGETSGSVKETIADDVFVGGKTQMVGIKSITEAATEGSGQQFESLVKGEDVTLAITDEPGVPGQPEDPQNPGNQGEAITVSITADKAEFAENEEQTFTVSLDKAVDRDVVVTLDGGKTVTIAKGTTSVGYQRPEQGEDVYKDSETISVALEDAKGADNAVFENLTLGDAATIQVVDTESPVTATLTANATSVAEGGEITYTVTLTGPAFADFTKHDGVKFELANGEVVEIAAGQTSGSVTITAPDDVFVGGQPAIENHIKGVLDNSDSEFEQLNTTGTTRVAVTDEPGTPGNPGEPGTPNAGDAITVSITADKASFAENEEQTFTVSLDKAVDRDVVVTLDGGKTVTIAKGTTSVAYQRPEQGEDVYKDSETISVALEDAKAADGAKFENLTLGEPATANVVDTIDKVTAELSVSPNPVVEGNEVEYTITLKGPEGTNLDLSKHAGLTIKLDNGKTIEIAAGKTSGSVKDTIADDVYVGGKTQTVGIESITEKATEGSGKQFENLAKGEDVTLAITDEPGTPGQPEDPQNPGNQGDKVTLTLSDQEAYEGSQVTITGTLSHAAGKDFTVTLDNGQTLAFKAGATTATTKPFLSQGEDPYIDNDVVSIGVKTVGDHGFENLVYTDKAVLTIKDTIDPTDVTIKAIVTKTSVIDVDNVGNTDSFTVKAYGTDGKETKVSKIKGTNHDGFGVSGKTSGSGDERELGFGDKDLKPGEKGVSEKIEVEFNNPVQTFDVQFAWRNNRESAKVEFFDEDDKSVGWAIISGGGRGDAVVTYYDATGKITRTDNAPGGSDNVDQAYTFEPGSGEAFTKAEFTAVGYDDDYMIHSVSYKEVKDGDAISLPTDQVSDVLFEIKTSNPPDASKYDFENTFPTAKVQIGDKVYTVELDANGRGTVAVQSDGKTDLTATVIEVNGNFEKVNLPVEMTLQNGISPEVSLELKAETEDLVVGGGDFDGGSKDDWGGHWTLVQGKASTKAKDQGLLTVDDDDIGTALWNPKTVVESMEGFADKVPAGARIEIDLGWNNGWNGFGNNGASMGATFSFNGVELLRVVTPQDNFKPGSLDREHWVNTFNKQVLNADVQALNGARIILGDQEYSGTEIAKLMTWALAHEDTDKRNDPGALEGKLSKITILLPENMPAGDGDGKLRVEFARIDPRWGQKSETADDIQIGSFKLVVPDNSGDQPGEGVKTTFKAEVVITDDDSTHLKEALIKVQGLADGDLLKLASDKTFHVDREGDGSLTIRATEPQHIDAWNKFLSHLEFTTTDTAGKAISITVTDAEGNASKPATESLSAEPAAALAAQRFSAMEHVDDSTLDASQPHDDLAAAHRVSTSLDEHGSASSTEGAVRSLIGGDGDDILIAGSGDTILTGGKGADTFTWQKGDFGHDIVKDFNPDEGDKLDLSGLLNELNGTADIASYIRTTEVDGSQVIEVSTKGDFTGEQAAKGGTVDVSITLEGYTGDVMDHLIAKPENHV